MESNLRLSILILNWNGVEDTSRLLRQLASQASQVAEADESIEILVLDNGSDTSPPRWWNELPLVRVIVLSKNLGYSGGMARLSRIARGDYFWLLNNDTTLMSDSLSAALSALDEGFLGARFPLVFNEDGSIQSRDSRWNPVLGWRSGPLAANEDRALFGDIFVAPIVSRRCVLELGLFPIAFHTYGEDLDACYAMSMHGFSIARVTSVRLFHRKSSSKPRDSALRYEFECQGAGNVIASALLNYSWWNYWAIPLLTAKILSRELFARQSRKVLLSVRGVRAFAGTPFRALGLAIQLRPLRRQRQHSRVLADSAVWRIGRA